MLQQEELSEAIFNERTIDYASKTYFVTGGKLFFS